MIRVLRTSTISIGPERKAFWFFFYRPGLTALRILWCAGIALVLYVALSAAGVSLAGNLFLSIDVLLALVFAPFLIVRIMMKSSRDAFRQKEFDKIMQALDALAEKCRKRRFARRFDWFLYNDNAYPRDVYVDVTAAAFARWAGKKEAAQERLEKITETRPDNVLAWHYLAEIFAEEGDTTIATHYFDRALEICPTFHYAKAVKGAWLYAWDKPILAKNTIKTVPLKERLRYSALPSLAAAFALEEDRPEEARNILAEEMKKRPVDKMCKEMRRTIFPDLYKPDI
jgi:tetratricopeptide (TPR) repeat protein